ncbi:hypothetical protein PG994_004175 [Apiospora phragmitis]|uniref:Uncharacterized protein n=1 Tax=Apiospora phragmitis TaxID=2905665 RepID=A0ABR1VPV1_9PEZI
MAYNALSTSILPARRLDEGTVSDQVSSYSSATVTGTKGTVSSLSHTPVYDVPLSASGAPPRQDASSFEKPSHRSKASTSAERRQYRVFTQLQWEILSILLSIGIIVAMFVLLVEYDGKVVTDWRFPINLTTLLALLSTVLRAALFVPITSIISQAKWKWFGDADRPRPLQDLQDIDMGSRSMLGALHMVPLAARASVPTLIAVLLSVVSLGIGPFVQQAIGTQPCDQTVRGRATVPYTHFVSSPNYVALNTASRQSDITAMVYASLTAVPGDPTGSEIRFECTTGNCTFTNGSPARAVPSPEGGLRNGSSVFSTMALCHKCLDVIDMVSFKESTMPTQLDARLPNGLSLTLGGAPFANGPRPSKFGSMTGNLTWMGDKLDADTRHLAAVALANVTLLTFNHAKDDLDMDQAERRRSVVASTCLLYACTRTYHVSIADGKLAEEQMSPCWVGDTVYTLANEPGRSFEDGDAWACSRNGGRDLPRVPAEQCGGDLDTEQCYYRQDKKHAVGMMGALRKSFTQACDIFNGGFVCSSAAAGGGGSDDGQGSWAEALFAANATAPKIEAFFGRFATTVSSRYRMTFGGSKPYFIDAMSEPPYGQVQGTVHQTTACNVVHLAWLAFPAAITAVALAILLWTMAESWMQRRDRPVWKDSILPFLLYSHRFQHEARGDATVVGEEGNHYTHGDVVSSSSGENKPLLETGEMEDVARNMQVRFEWPATGKRRDVEVDSLLQE